MARQTGSRAQPQPQSEIVTAYLEIPIITRVILTATVGLSLLPHLGLLGQKWLVLRWDDVFNKLQLWKLVTPFFVHWINFGFIFTIMTMSWSSRYLETELFVGRPEDYIYFFILTGVPALAGAKILGIRMLGDTLEALILTLWSLHNSEKNVTYFCSLNFKAKYLPLVQFGLSYVLKTHNTSAVVLGIVLSNIYFYLKNNYASSGGLDYLETPSFFKKLFPSKPRTFSTPSGYQVITPRGRGLSSNGEYNWGKGSRLGN